MSGPPITAVYADGGVIQVNPSPHGGTWAWLHVNAAGACVASASGVLPATPDWPRVSNNVAEFAALVQGLEALPFGWAGVVYSDSQITLGRLFWGWRLTGIPGAWLERGTQALRRLDLVCCQPILLDGHPTQAQLAAGVGKRGHAVSAWNVECDRLCRTAGRAYLPQCKER